MSKNTYMIRDWFMRTFWNEETPPVKEKRKVTEMFIYMKDSPSFSLINNKEQEDFTTPWADFVNWFKSGYDEYYSLPYSDGELVRVVTMSRDSISRIEIGEVYE